MRALRTCDFCGAEAAGTFAILPDELDPTDAEQRRVVLCPDCKERLEALLEPLLARAGADVDDGGTAESDANGGVEGDGGESEAVDGYEDDGNDGSEPHERDRSESRASRDSPSSEEDRPQRGRDASERPDGDEVVVESESEAGDAGDPEVDSTGATDADEPAASPPPNYPNVLRLLRNREFPMERAAVESLAAGAYDLEGPEVEAIVDHAIANGELVADGDQLRRP